MNLEIEFMGVLEDVTRARTLSLDFEQAPTLRELLADLEERYGEEFSTRIFRNATPPRRLQMGTRIFVNGNIVDDRALDTALPPPAEGKSSAAVLVYFLPAACGG